MQTVLHSPDERQFPSNRLNLGASGRPLPSDGPITDSTEGNWQTKPMKPKLHIIASIGYSIRTMLLYLRKIIEYSLFSLCWCPSSNCPQTLLS